ncbi:MAG: Rrf2 family transcriptional regulator [Alphaproteobacteria bacterium]|nr:Rrf2 family transcriptional regulator [Alphaproteobacteria bacterium]
MRLTRRDRGMVAVAIILDVAFNSTSDVVVSANELAERTGILRRTIEPVLQALSRAGLLDSIRGPHGGYRLGRPARLILVSEVIALGLSSLDDSGPELKGRLQRAVVDPLWSQFDLALEEHMRGVTVETLLQRASKAGLGRPVTEPLNFAI